MALCWQHEALSTGRPLLPVVVVEQDQEQLIRPTGPAEFDARFVAPAGRTVVFQTEYVVLMPVAKRVAALPPRQQPNPGHDERQPAHLAQREAFAQHH